MMVLGFTVRNGFFESFTVYGVEFEFRIFQEF